MMYKIVKSNLKTTATGKTKLDCTVTDLHEVTTSGVTIWSDFPGFAGLLPGSVIEAELVPAKDPRYGPTLFAPKPSRTFTPKTTGVVTAAEITSKSVKVAQDRKNESIAYFNSLNSAISFVTAFKDQHGILDSDDAYQAVLKIRDKFLREWQKYEVEEHKTIPF